MAITNEQLNNLLASLNDDKMAAAIEKRLEKGQALSRSQLKAIDAVRKAENKLSQEILKQIKIRERAGRLSEREQEKLKALKSEYAQLVKNSKAFDEVAAHQDKATESSKKFNEAKSQTINKLKSGVNELKRYTSALGILDGILTGFERLYTNWFSLQEKTARGMGNLAMRTGASATQLNNFSQQANRMRDTLASLGGSADAIEESLQFIGDAALALRTDMRGMSEQMMHDFLELQRGLGTSAEQAAQIFRTLETGIEGGNESIHGFAGRMQAFAESIGGNASTLTQDYLDARDSLVLFGRDGGEVFRRTATFANHLGFETRRILDMSRRFDMFSQASQHVNQLNAMFGTTISSLELMQEQDPVRRIEMITNAIRDQGLSWENMDRYQQMALAQAMGVSEADAARLMRGETMSQIQEEQLQRQREQEQLARRTADAQDRVLSIIERTSTLFAGWRRYLEQIINDVSEALDPIFRAIHDSSTGIMVALRGWVRQIAENPRFQEVVRNIANWIRELPESIERFMPTWEQIERKATEIWPTVRDIANTLMGIFEWAAENPETVGIALGVGAIALMAAQLAPMVALIGPGGLLVAGAVALGAAFVEASMQARNLHNRVEEISGVAPELRTEQERGELTDADARARLAMFHNRASEAPAFARLGAATWQLGANMAGFFGATGVEREIEDHLANFEMMNGGANFRELAATRMRAGAPAGQVFQDLLRSASIDPANESLIRESFGIGRGEDLSAGIMRGLSEISSEIPRHEPVFPSSSATESSAVVSAPATDRTATSAPIASGGSTEVRIASVEMDGRAVGRVVYEVART